MCKTHGEAYTSFPVQQVSGSGVLGGQSCKQAEPSAHERKEKTLTTLGALSAASGSEPTCGEIVKERGSELEVVKRRQVTTRYRKRNMGQSIKGGQIVVLNGSP